MTAPHSTETADAIPDDLEALRFPLHGSRLIEASAGTGKTFTIAALYVRLVLGHGGEAAFPRALTPPEILVVTFTEAAARELRDRIRARLTEAAGCFQADPADVVARPPGEDLLHDLRAEHPPQDWPACARKLRLAAEWMDEAAVSTIHSWCNRMLREHAFDSGSLFTQTLETDQTELVAEAVRDYWRSFIAPLEAPLAAGVECFWSGPEALQKEIRGLITNAQALEPRPAPAESTARVRAARQAVLAPAKRQWARWVPELRAMFDDAVEKRLLNGTRLRPGYYNPWLDALASWAADPEAVELTLTDAAWNRLTPDGMKDAAATGKDPLEHPAFEQTAPLKAALDNLPTARIDLLAHAARWVVDRLAREKALRAQMGFDDLLTRLDAALQGDSGERLATVIRAQFPVVLIDEFQDTDPVQYRIFDTIYRIARNPPETAIVLIGDPKQAIYAFRGADIHTYLAARRACAGRLYTLRRNFRSTVEMVSATNRLFIAAEHRMDGEGAFMFRGASANPVPFVPADANGRQDALMLAGTRPTAMTLWWLPPADGGKPMSKASYLAQMAASCATEIVRLLTLGQSGTAVIGDAKGKGSEKGNEKGRGRATKDLRPGDLAVLVANGNEAHEIRAALSARGVRSVYLSEGESVFDTDEAVDLGRWLAACAEPDDGRLLRAALATPTLALDLAALDRLNHDERAWEARVLQFRAYRECWRRQGVLPMVRRLLHDFQVPERLLAGSGPALLPAGDTVLPASTPSSAPLNGERVLTNLLHLAELLQHASVLIDGEHGLIRHLAEQRDAGEGRSEVRQVRLESDANLVQVVTVHKSKGLEYPLVFLPFACAYRETKPDDLPLKWHDDAGRVQLALEPNELALKEADRERLAEDLRKLYVALTRARHATWVGVAPVDGFERSALGYLMTGGAAAAGDALASLLEALRGDCPHVLVEQAPQARDEVFDARASTTVRLEARTPMRSPHRPWWIASYSAIAHGSAGQVASAPAAETPTEDTLRESYESAGSSPTRPSAPRRGPQSASAGLHDFPRGADAGTFLHDLLEWAATQGFGEVVSDPGPLRDTIARRCSLRGWSQWIDPLTAWVQRFLAIPFTPAPIDGVPQAPFRLDRIGASIPEMEFWISATDVDLALLDREIRAGTLGGASRPPIDAGRINGMLKGFIDLVFEHDGRYYVADYKSNRLGDDDEAYTPDAMAASVLRERYDLQYVLYLLALHRLLRARLPDYDYDRHVGGAVYLYLRGADAPGHGVHAERPPKALIEALDRLFSRATAKEAA